MNQNEFALSLPPEGYSPIFIGGQPCSGTTLMRRLLASHPHIACGPESNLFRDNRLERIYTDCAPDRLMTSLCYTWQAMARRIVALGEEMQIRCYARSLRRI